MARHPPYALRYLLRPIIVSLRRQTSILYLHTGLTLQQTITVLARTTHCFARSARPTFPHTGADIMYLYLARSTNTLHTLHAYALCRWLCPPCSASDNAVEACPKLRIHEDILTRIARYSTISFDALPLSIVSDTPSCTCILSLGRILAYCAYAYALVHRTEYLITVVKGLIFPAPSHHYALKGCIVSLSHSAEHLLCCRHCIPCGLVCVVRCGS